MPWGPQQQRRPFPTARAAGRQVCVNITFADAASRQKVLVPGWPPPAPASLSRGAFIFRRHDVVHGEVVVSAPPGEPAEYTGLVVSLIGEITTIGESHRRTEFHRSEQLLAHAAGAPMLCDGVRVVPYELPRVQLDLESYYGATVRLRWVVRAELRRRRGGDVTEEEELCVENPTGPPAALQGGVRLDLGVSDLLRIEVEFERRGYHLQDVVLGRCTFVLASMPLRTIELSLRRREVATGRARRGPEQGQWTTMGTVEIMDGEPVAGEWVPIRMFLGALDLSPTRAIPGAFSVRYYLHLVLTDSSDRRYYKQHEVTLWRGAAP